MADVHLNAEEVLKLEFEYAQTTAEQAQDARATILNLYIVLAGGVGSIIIGLAQANGAELPRGIYVIVFGLLALIGFFTLAKLVRLRQAWHDSALTMNRIKDYYVERFPELAPALRWRTTTIPPLGKWWTITFNLALLVAIIDSTALAVAMHFTGVRLPLHEYAAPVFAALVFFAWQAWFYFYQLPPSDK
ncbi:MAG: hypothetical protein FJ009_00870 [Chloroflexi bacterium]|nr:hypothetical protein [Chloroflexota bacterium]